MRWILLAGVIGLLVVGAGALVAFPAVLGAERTALVAADGILLLAYGGWAAWGPGPSWRAVGAGLLAGCVQVADIAREYFTAWPSILLAAALGLSLICFGAAGDGWRGGVWAAVTAMVVVWLAAWLMNFAAIDRLAQEQILDREYASGSLKDPRSYTVWNTFSSAFSHLVVLPLLGAAAGAVAGYVATRLAGPHRHPRLLSASGPTCPWRDVKDPGRSGRRGFL